MAGQPANIPVRYYTRMGEVLLKAGVDLAKVLKQADLGPDLLSQPNAMLRIDQVEALVAATLQISGRPDLALDIGYALRITSHSVVGYAMLSSPTVGHSMRLLARYFRLIMPSFSIRYHQNHGFLEFEFQPAMHMTQTCLIFHLEAMVAGTYVALGDLLGEQLSAYDVYLAIPKPAHTARYAEMHQVRIHFLKGWSATGIRLRFASDIMDQRPVLSDPDAFRMAEEHCRAHAEDVLASGKVADWVAKMLREATDGIPTLNELAQTLNISARTLDRHLAMEQTGFRTLFHQIRHERARQLLAIERFTITQIAYELGYSDLANFTRAFRNQEGISPVAYRGLQLGKSH